MARQSHERMDETRQRTHLEFVHLDSLGKRLH